MRGCEGVFVCVCERGQECCRAHLTGSQGAEAPTQVPGIRTIGERHSKNETRWVPLLILNAVPLGLDELPAPAVHARGKVTPERVGDGAARLPAISTAS